MSAIQLAGVLPALRARSAANKRAGGDGFVSTSTISLTVGLNTRTVRRVLDAGLQDGTLERRLTGFGTGYSYRLAPATV